MSATHMASGKLNINYNHTEMCSKFTASFSIIEKSELKYEFYGSVNSKTL